MPVLFRRHLSLLVCDIAGTVARDHGVVYSCLRRTLLDLGCAEDTLNAREWHGKSKRDVLNQHLEPDTLERAESLFESHLSVEYFDRGGIELVHKGVPKLFHNLRARGIKVALNTGYSRHMKDKVIAQLGLADCIDASVSSDDVLHSRPHPAMIHRLMDMTNTRHVQHVIKAGDTHIDMLEGYNAGCGLLLGVLSGAGTRDELSKKANVIVSSVMHLENVVRFD